MSTVKISQLPTLASLNANTANSLFMGVDIPTGITGKFTAHTLAQGLYSNEILNVGVNPVVYQNVIGQFSGNSSTYLQVNLQNFDHTGSSDYVASASDSDNTNSYVDLGINSKSFADPVYSSMKPYDSYLYAHGPSHYDYRGNLVIGTASSQANVLFIAGGTESNNIVAKITANGLVLNTQSYIVFADGSKQTVAYNSGTETTQNTRLGSIETVDVNQNTAISVIQGVDLTQNTSIGLAWNKANTALQNTTSTLNGDLTTLGNVTTNFIRASYKTTNDFTPLVQLTQTASGSVIAPQFSGFSLHTTGREGVSNRIVIDALGSGSLPNFLTRHARGVANTPTPSQSGDIIGRYSSFGYGNTKFNSTSDSRIDFVALENFTDAAHGTSATIYTTPIGSNTANAVIVASTANTGLYSANTYVAGELTVAGNSWIQKVNTANFQVIGTANVSGTLSVVGVITGNAQVILQNTNFSATESALTISATPTIALPANDGYMIHTSGKNGVPSRIVADSYGTGAYSVYTSRTARGTVDVPLPVQSNDIIGRFSANGYGNTKFQTFGTGRIDFVAAENYTDANTGSQIKFWNCPIGSNTLTNIATFNGDSVTFSGVVNPVKGFIYTPQTYPGAQTAITINFANNSVVRAQTSTGLTVSFSNYTTGKVVELWVTNTAGTNQTFTHGCSALNSSINATTYNIPGTSSILARYMCFDGDVANTFVSIIHA